MHVVVAGGTGFIGRAFVRSLLDDGRQVTVLSRSKAGVALPGAATCRWLGADSGWEDVVGGADAIVHLAGASVASGRWTARRKAEIRASRIDSARHLVTAIGRSKHRPAVWVGASAVGYYGPCADELVTEEHPAGSDFLADVCKEWEAAAQSAEGFGVRVVRVRFGLVLGADGGALPRLVLPFRFFAGGPLGDGRAWVPWIHRDDVVGILRLALTCPDASGPINAAAPSPCRQAEFARTIGLALRRPSWLPVPATLLRLALGEVADSVMLSGQRVMPQRALALGYQFRYADLRTALGSLLSSQNSGQSMEN